MISRELGKLKPLKILFILQDIPFPISDGMRWKVFYLLQYLSERHQCDVIAFSPDSCPDIDRLKCELPRVNWLSVVRTRSGVSHFIRAAVAFLRLHPPSLGRFQSPVFNRVLREALKHQRYDVIHYDIVNMAQHYIEGLPSVHSPNDATSLYYARMAASEKCHLTRLRLKIGSFLLGRYEQHNYPKFSKIHVVSNVDADYLRTFVANADIVSLPFGGAPAEVPLLANQMEGTLQDNNLVLVLGGANVPGVAAGIEEFIRLAVPEISRRFPSVKFRFQGKGTKKLLRNIGVSMPNIEASVWVDDLDLLIRSAAVVVLPDKAGAPGIKTRALQALGCGATVVGTSAAFDGLQEYVRSGKHCLITESIPSLANEILMLLEGALEKESLGHEAEKLVRDQLSWSRIGPKFEDLYRTAVISHDLARKL